MTDNPPPPRYRGGARNSRTIYLGDDEVGYANDRATRDMLVAYANAGIDALAGRDPAATITGDLDLVVPKAVAHHADRLTQAARDVIRVFLRVPPGQWVALTDVCDHLGVTRQAMRQTVLRIRQTLGDDSPIVDNGSPTSGRRWRIPPNSPWRDVGQRFDHAALTFANDVRPDDRSGKPDTGGSTPPKPRPPRSAHADARRPPTRTAGPPEAQQPPPAKRAPKIARPPTPLGDPGGVLRRTHDRIIAALLARDDPSGTATLPDLAVMLGIGDTTGERALSPYVERLVEHGTLVVTGTVGATRRYVLHPALLPPGQPGRGPGRHPA